VLVFYGEMERSRPDLLNRRRGGDPYQQLMADLEGHIQRLKKATLGVAMRNMTTDDARCPYCVQGYDFRLLSVLGDGFVCDRCGHVVEPKYPKFQCGCRKCRQLHDQPKWEKNSS
jgi:hypothetical protein